MHIQPSASNPTVADLATARAQLGPIGQRRLDYAVHRTYLAAERAATFPDSTAAADHVTECAAAVARLASEVAEREATARAV